MRRWQYGFYLQLGPRNPDERLCVYCDRLTRELGGFKEKSRCNGDRSLPKFSANSVTAIALPQDGKPYKNRE
jgi:hypothetical protein